MSYADIKTEQYLKDLERRLKREYADAWVDLNRKTTAYFERFEKRDKEYREKLDSGKIKPPAGVTIEQHYAQWRKAQMGRGERWIALRDDMARRIGEVNIDAAAMVNNVTPAVYSLNHNFSAYMIDDMVRRAGDPTPAWNLVQENAIAELMIGENHTDFRVLSVNPKRDYAWNTELITKCLTAGIMQGESIPNITKRFINVMGQNQAAAIRNARTAVTSAQAAGREKSFEQARDLGIEVWDEWDSTLDGSTRKSHRNMDGERKPPDQDTFSNGLRYPADPWGAPAEVYNCRCTIVGYMPKYSKDRKMTYYGQNAEKAYSSFVDRNLKRR